jgi:tetratricopeptide (TPR) repeat protein
LATLAMLITAVGCDKVKARDQLNKGVQSYKNARYEEAIEHFKNSVTLDPSLVTARLYLGTAYMQLYVPGADTEENNRAAQQAIEAFQSVLDAEKTPPDAKSHALKSIASLYYNMKDFDKSREYYQKVTQVDPNDPESDYMIGVIAWADTYKTAADIKSKVGLKVDDPYIKDKEHQKACEDVRKANADKINAGLAALDKALQIKPEYEDAMAYENLLYRRKADIECGNADARTADIKTADDWTQKTLAMRQAKAERQAQQSSGGITLDKPKDDQ